MNEFDVDNSQKVIELRSKYPNFIYDSFSATEDDDNIYLSYRFIIEGLTEFNPSLTIPKKDYIKKELNDFSKAIAFNIGMVELISYWKSTFSPNVCIKCGNLTEKQKAFWKKLYFNGLGELRYRNNINISFDEFMQINANESSEMQPAKLNAMEAIDYSGYIVPIGGGKDSNVTLENLPIDVDEDYCLMINPKQVGLDCCYARGFKDSNIIEVKRTLDPKIVEMGHEGYINGHTPFSAMVSFVTYFIAYHTNKKYIALSNESSANESNVRDSEGDIINHQYSKSFEYENDFNNYVGEFLPTPIKYFSFLRPLNELQIAKLFAKSEKYHSIFKSCNVGSKSIPWVWCGHCAKCLFVYTILGAFLSREEIQNIFKKDLYADETLLETFEELAGYKKVKPFDCVGTFEEVNYAIALTIQNYEKEGIELPYLLQYYKDHYELVDTTEDITKRYNEQNNLPEDLDEILRKAVL